ncbi:Hsp20/alpha crystallin family protein, partial [Teichococcus deserti]|uniref:Hsp20/alpha crystallin family protein n=1 Tax=Teichococcus deserti TaxID=1817963 RepID=UPI001A95D3DF
PEPPKGQVGWTALPFPPPHRIFAEAPRPGLSQRLAIPPAHEPGAATVEALRQAMRKVLARPVEPATTGPSPRRPRSQVEAGPGGWQLRIELPGIAPESVALWLSHGALMITAAGACAYAVRLPVPPEADPASLRWHCAHGLLQAHLAPRRPDPEAAA